ncbi:phage tail protein [Corynebacterium callunae]|uniref:Gp37-like protein n=1 Tax=Corynebacterium callunae TaxID=1721 RepID=UPI001FFF2B4A|nr:phage tail protein [Corynebacterium callunae]MCK2200175.1 phage tail protein [Corynebacterium callunae]
MTSPTLERLQASWDDAQEKRDARRNARRTPPLVRIWDGDWNFIGVVHGEISGTFSWKMNDTGTGELVLPLDHYISKWVVAYKDRKKNVHVTVDKDGARWGGRMRRFRLVKDKDGKRSVVMPFLHDYEEVKRIYMWSNAFLPAIVQFPRVSILAGPSRWVLKTMLLMNLWRTEGSLWALPDDPLDLGSWTDTWDMNSWSKVIKPSSLLGDGTPWTIASSRFKTWHEMAEDTLGDAELMVECRRWLTGDPPPWPGADLRNGCLVIDIVDKSGRWSPDGHGAGGNILTGIWNTVTSIAENGVDNEESMVSVPDTIPEYGVAGWLGTVPQRPYVTYRDGAVTGVEAAEFVWEPSQAVQVTGGGHSAPGVNETISAGIQAIGNILGTAIFVPTAGTIADTFLKPIYEDTIAAFMAVKSPIRSMESGWSHYEEFFARGSDQAYTLAGIIAMRAGFWETREKVSHQLSVQDGAPWFIGESGQGHFFLGDRIASTVIGLPEGEMIVEQVHGLTYAWDRDSMGWDIDLGDPRSGESGLDRVVREVSKMTSAIQQLGVR